MQTREFVKLLGIIYNTKTCNKCGEEVRHQIILAREWKMLGIPLLPVSKQYYLSCPKCGNREQISRTETRESLDQITKEKKNHNHRER